MKRFFTVLLFALFVFSVVLNVIQFNNKKRISDSISHYIIANVQQLANVYEGMYTNDEPNRFFESSLNNAIGICDNMEEEFDFYSVIYPKRDMFLEYVIDDYKLLMRTMKNKPDLIEDAQVLHKQLQQYILSYVDYGNNSAKMLYETDKQIKEKDNGTRHLLHHEIVKLSKR